MLSIIYVGKKTILTVLLCNLTKNSIFETGRITGIPKGLNCTVLNDENVSIECSRLPDSMSLPPCLRKVVLVKGLVALGDKIL